MAASRLAEPWKCKEGETFEKVLRFSVRGVPVDISGWMFRMDIRIARDSGIVASATIAARSPATDGIADLSIPFTALSIEPRTYEFDLRADYSGKRKFYVEGNFEVEPAITRT